MRSFFLKMLNQLLTVGMGKEARLALAKDALAHPAMLTELILLVRSGSNVQRMKGAWVLSGIHALNRAKLIPFYESFMVQLISESTGGVKRELLRCFENIELEPKIAEQLLAITFDWITDETQDVAVRYLCLRLLKPIVKKYPELDTELQMQIELSRTKFGKSHKKKAR